MKDRLIIAPILIFIFCCMIFIFGDHMWFTSILAMFGAFRIGRDLACWMYK